MSETLVVRRALLLLFLFGSLGTGAELLLLEHTEGAWQILPLALVAVGGAGACVMAVRPVRLIVRTFQALMAVFVASGAVGILLHYRGNVEFEKELSPGAAGWDLFSEAFMGATPALAPGTMILLGGLGLVCAFMPSAPGGRCVN